MKRSLTLLLFCMLLFAACAEKAKQKNDTEPTQIRVPQKDFPKRKLKGKTQKLKKDTLLPKTAGINYITIKTHTAG